MLSRRSVLAFAACLILSGCGGVSRHEDMAADPLLPMPSARVDEPSDEAVAAAVQDLMRQTGGPLNTQYEFTRVDLDGDGRRDALVHLTNPYRTWCGIHGCTMLVMKADSKTFHYISQIRPVRPPLKVSLTSTNGWRDLIVHVDGRWTKTKDVALKFDGRGYPLDPNLEPALPQYAALGERVFPRW